MPVLTFHKDDPTLPDMSKEQKCDKCGAVFIGYMMYYRYVGKKIKVICNSCFARRKQAKP